MSGRAGTQFRLAALNPGHWDAPGGWEHRLGDLGEGDVLCRKRLPGGRGTAQNTSSGCRQQKALFYPPAGKHCPPPPCKINSCTGSVDTVLSGVPPSRLFPEQPELFIIIGAPGLACGAGALSYCRAQLET